MYAFLSMNLCTCLFIYSICTLAHRNTAPENGTAIRLPQRLLHLQSTFVITFAYMMVWYLWYRTYYVGTMWNLSACRAEAQADRSRILRRVDDDCQN